MHPLADFNFEAHRIRVSLDERHEPWFVAADICATLTIPSGHDASGTTKRVCVLRSPLAARRSSTVFVSIPRRSGTVRLK